MTTERSRILDNILVLSPVELLRWCEQHGEKISRTEWVPISRIVDEAMVVEEKHADDLYRIMKEGGFGQTQGIIARCRVGGATINDIVYDVADGFHRADGIRRHDGNKGMVKVEALYNCTDEELYDLRIQAQTAMKGIKFAKLATFMDGAWNSTPWKNKLTLPQAVKLTCNDSSGKILGLSQEEAEEIKVWARRRADLWMMDIVTLDNNLRTIKAVSPELVKRVRLGGSFEKGKLSLTLEQLRLFEAHLPQLYDIQEKIALFANSRSLSTVEISSLAAETAQAIDDLGDKFTGATLQEICANGKWLTGLVGTESKELPKVYYLGLIEKALRRLTEGVKYSNIDAGRKELILKYTSAIGDLLEAEMAEKKAPVQSEKVYSGVPSTMSEAERRGLQQRVLKKLKANLDWIERRYLQRSYNEKLQPKA